MVSDIPEATGLLEVLGTQGDVAVGLEAREIEGIDGDFSWFLLIIEGFYDSQP